MGESHGRQMERSVDEKARDQFDHLPFGVVGKFATTRLVNRITDDEEHERLDEQATTPSSNGRQSSLPRAPDFPTRARRTCQTPTS